MQLDVIAALHAESERKDGQIKAIRDDMEAAMERAKIERQAIVDEAERKIQGSGNKTVPTST
ncbi:hypothetical protein BCR33DRAFT_717374 [Rhizoclosmatium globosum]|uniref:Uncharacterized protein n=1 Tax=Rhizoclosmatium globosum TaxID=329046 RepID=A0A1Y2C9K2_9FUNG|nr:hypothetical protein BCR33DRAFT_717374 [Rhizoclosmatium globosum]|eukprot:ORY43713.1 hypothetical protein BCR33DRAFT_717374 [Rhizoclosmatium globosum]